ncbi:hypothetical protein [Marinisporobacter balticus]|uniref:Uncharacterized protein n=1 Tax=Marinisporobacter balticus TaxID=2018667 RepID=A0A4R2L8Q5_9FIRM|nr:hypothetical protein [Marinisporobacter balticus]TCO79088.1 hypothetical protein EV214_103140 [Marinisporobacter balticus]
MENELLQQILNELKTIKTDINDLKEGQSRIEEKLDATHTQVFRNTEGIEIIKNDLQNINNDLNFVEAATGKNITDIAALKRIK